jgi:hypothetical protein
VTSREKLAAELDAVRRESKIISLCVWAVAIGVMIYGVGNVYGLLTAHDVPGDIAWLLSPMVDAGLCVGLVGTRGLTRYGVGAGWIGALRWITALMTWGLNIATPITKEDVLGVFIHSVGPVLLFVVVEAAAYFQQKIGRVIADKQETLDKVDRDREAERAHRADVTAQLQAARAELSAVKAENQTLTDRLTAGAETGDAERGQHTLTVERLEAEIGSLRTALTTQAEKLTAEHHEALRKAKDKYTEKLTALRAETSTVSLTAYRRRATEQTSPQPGNKPAMSDEDAVQAMLTAHDDPDFEWSKNAVRTLTGAGFNRIPRLIELWFTAAAGKAAGDQAVNQ